MPPTNLKKHPKAAAAMTSTGKKKNAVDAPLLPFLPMQVSTFQQVSYSKDRGNWIEVSVFAGGFVKKGKFKFELASDRTTLAFSAKLEPAARKGGGIVSLLSQVSN